MTSIVMPSETSQPIVFINVFSVAPENQQELVTLLERATEALAQDTPGFIAATLHRGLDGTKVAMYARWRSMADYAAMRENPAPRAYLARALEIATFEPGSYEVARVFAAVVDGPPPG